MMTLLTNFLVFYGATILAAPAFPERWLVRGDIPTAQKVVCVFFVPIVAEYTPEQFVGPVAATRWEGIVIDLRDRPKDTPVQAHSGFT